MNNYKNLKVWQKAIDLTVEVYAKTNNFPDKERYGLVSQINRCAVSVASNIAEGAGRNSSKEFSNFLGITLGSAAELETQLIIANRLKYLSETDLASLSDSILEIQKMVIGLQKNIRLELKTKINN